MIRDYFKETLFPFQPANILLDETGHVRISDLGLACDFSKKKPHASVGTHGYMAPEVLQKGTAYDSSADWFSLGCMIYKLLKGHSPFRNNKTKDKHEIDRMTLTMVRFSVGQQLIILFSFLFDLHNGFSFNVDIVVVIFYVPCTGKNEPLPKEK